MSIAARERPIIFSGPMIRALLAGRKTMTRRVIKAGDRPSVRHRGSANSVSGQVVYHEGAVWDAEIFEAVRRGQDGLQPIARCPFGAVGDRLWVRETFAIRSDVDPEMERSKALHYLHYRATYRGDMAGEWHDYGCWRPAIFMPRWASRITLEITGIRAERLQAICKADAIAEGATQQDGYWSMDWSRLGEMSRWASGVTREAPVQPLTTFDIGMRSAWSAFGNYWERLNGRTYPWAGNPWVWALTFYRVDVGPAVRYPDDDHYEES